MTFSLFITTPILLKKGQISFHHLSLIHGSLQNNSQMMRQVIVMNLQDEKNASKPIGTITSKFTTVWIFCAAMQTNDFPDYTDPAIFPTIWSEV